MISVTQKIHTDGSGSLSKEVIGMQEFVVHSLSHI